MTVNSSALQAVEWCNPSTSCYGFCRSIAIIASGDGRQKVKRCVCALVCVCVCVCYKSHSPLQWRLASPGMAVRAVCVYVCVCVWRSILQPCKLLNGAIPAQAATASAVASLSSPSAMGVQWSNGVCVCVCFSQVHSSSAGCAKA